MTIDTIIMDIDGCLADNGEDMRKTYVTGEMSKKEFFDRLTLFHVNPWAKALMEGFSHYHRAIVTSRLIRDTEPTMKWLHEQEIPFEAVHFRQDPAQSSALYKGLVVKRFYTPFHTIRLAVDDDPEVVYLYESMGLPTLYVESNSHCYDKKIDLGDIL